jgi:DeoR family suf operon transcriptional repressor
MFGIIPIELEEDFIVKSVTSNGKQSTRDIILHTLKVSNQAKVDELADAADVSPVTVRHHLNALQADSLIEVSSVRRKVGRPYYVYSLSEKGHELFPRKYIRLTNRLLDELKASLPDEVIMQIFNGIVETIVRQHRSKFEGLMFEDRLTYLVDLLAEEGFLAKWEHANGKYKITEFSCPYYSVVDQHAEICGLDKELIVNVLQTPIEQHRCMVNGDNCCEFTFSASGIDA